MENLFKGWEYINALLQFIKKNSEEKCKVIAPRYIFRGITQRHFTSSVCISNEIVRSRKNITVHDDPNRSVEDEVKDCYTDYCNKLHSNFYKDLCVKAPQNYLEEVTKDRYFELTKPEYIRSGAAVRMNSMNRRTQADYVYYLKEMILDMQRRYPSYRDNYDLDILAEIQHKGGASCLVDFSSNFLVALWFATQDYNSPDEHMGYLFCYDTNADLFINDTLTIVDSNTKVDIESLLRRTQKSIKYNGRDKYQYLLWKPSIINDRINRQDSIFIFGIEKFKVDEHPIQTLPIPHLWKQPIQQTLKTLFGITSESIYADVAGYASSNTKLDSCKITTNYFLDNILDLHGNESKELLNKESMDLFQRAMSCIIKRDYSLALKYLHAFEMGMRSYLRKLMEMKDSTLEQQMFFIEIIYSKALCYRHLKKVKKSLDSYRDALDRCLTFIERNEYYEMDATVAYYSLSEKQSMSLYATNKLYKILDGYTDVLYDNDDFNTAYDVIKSILENDKISSNTGTKYLLYTALNELISLRLLSGEKVTEKLEFTRDFKSSRYYPFCNILNHLFDYINSLLLGCDKKQLVVLVSNLNDSIRNGINYCSDIIGDQQKVSDIFMYWDLGDLIRVIDTCKIMETKKNETIKNSIKDAIAKVVDCQHHLYGCKRVEKY